MTTTEINGGAVAYDLLGDPSSPLVVLTPGGRFSKDIPGLRPLAEKLVDGGYRVLLWDRPNCGASDVQFYGQSESHMRAETLYQLLSGLGVEKCIIAGGSGGARDSMLTVMLHPELFTKLVIWNIVGGIYGTYNLGAYYVLPNLHAVRSGGMEAVVAMPAWQPVLEANPKNRDRFLSWDPDEYEALMHRWLNAYVMKPGQTIPGVEDELFQRIRIPTMIIRGGAKDLDHPKRTSLEVSCLIEGSKVIDPPWPEDAWEEGQKLRALGKVDHYNGFDTWPLAAPAILDFLGS